MLDKKRLKKLRNQFNYSQNEIAERLGVSQQQYQRLESGQTEFPRETTLNKLAEILDTTKEYLTDTEILPYYQKLSSLRKEESINFVKKQLKEQELE
ncbi:MAG: helix-turn-helix transcriptional regulator [Lactococcus raffinolactis]|jgi:transcriptional regulator with XRE-family HTH domain|uniref:Helix-turn-helix domain-containing protein n=1 Tax=Pseudolactococcus raffinolactis TaxID=1366 RepID=A0A6H0UJQ9_9LACT|nr:helix-turn-helix transcriptional regulator [Lactococcus raffinolactis]MBQ2654861.1 helix-turn-helix transcriptional regulator [Methanobrevibacter sp.]MBR2787432.1 helix-turn-helix transcriptional regulator [Clostridia bacterium]MBR3209900.1 helix-turn-helix transcriptional regulator [Bacilli bacterium]MCI2096206.1 helix-turn-helix domain-containing protein [Lactococcus lactis]NBK99528.1 XRE family transcriptional regulator [Erysipelotrichia bacterium]